jgi:hypothetical protein
LAEDVSCSQNMKQIGNEKHKMTTNIRHKPLLSVSCGGWRPSGYNRYVTDLSRCLISEFWLERQY